MSKTTTTPKGNTMTITHTTTQLAPVTIGSTTYRVEMTTFSNGMTPTIYFYGRTTSRGTSSYKLETFTNDRSTGYLVSQSSASGQSMRYRTGDLVRLTVLGDIIEVQ
jgi:hypothetical protein